MLKAFLRPVAVMAATFSIGVLAPAARAQTTSLTLERVLADVETVNLSVLSNREFIGQAEESAVRTRSALRPQVSGRASQSRGTAGNGTASRFSASVGASLTIFDLQQHRTLL